MRETPVIGSMEKQLEAQSKEVQFCQKCVISNQRPRIVFDAQGICGACRYMEGAYREIDWRARAEELGDLLSQHRSCRGYYDVIVPTSGGKDSGYVASVLRDEYGMHPLTVCFSPFARTPIGQQNYDAFKRAGFTVIEGHPNEKLRRLLTRLYFEEHGDAWGPFGLGQMAWPHLVARQWGVPLIFYGENGEAAYSGDPSVVNLRGMPVDMWADQYHKGVTIDQMLKLAIDTKPYFQDIDILDQDLDLYRAPLATAAATDMHWMSFYRRWVPQENYYHAQQHTGFMANSERSEGTYSKYASLDDKLDGFHYWMAFIKFGIGRTTSDAAHEIRDGHITREEAVALVHRYDGEFPKRYYQAFLDYLGISATDFWSVVNWWRERQDHIWVRLEGEWLLRQQVDRSGPVRGSW